MKIIATIEARTGSSRLPGKVLKPILNKPLLELMIERVKKSKLLDEIVIATSTNQNDSVLEDLAKRLNIGCFRGSEEDVLERVLGAAKAFQADCIVEFWGDTPLIDPEIIDAAISLYKENRFDCVATCLDKTFPWGQSLLIFSTKILDEVSRITNDPVDRENVSPYIYTHPEKYSVGHLVCPPEIRRPDLRLVVDEQGDFIVVSKIFEHFQAIGKSEFNTKDIIAYLDANPEVAMLNKNIKQRVVKKG